MSILSRSTPLTRYRVKEDANLTISGIREAIQAHAFSPADNQQSDVIGHGWTSSKNFTDTEFAESDFIYGDYVLIAFRIDEAKVPARVLEMETQRQCKSIMETMNYDRLSARARREIKEATHAELKKRCLASINVTDIAWNVSTGIVYINATGRKMCEQIEAYFKTTFGLTIIPALAYSEAERSLPDHSAALRELRPMNWGF